MRRALALAVAAGIAVGCAPPAATSASPLHPRPRDLPVRGLDPCTVLTPAQLDRLGVDSPTATTSADGFATPQCQWSRFPAEPQERYGAATFTADGAGYALASTTGAEIDDVAGFAAVRTTQPYASLEGRNCVLFLDVADGQSLVVQYLYEGRTEPMSTAIACDRARTAAELMLATLSDQIAGQ